MMTTHTVTIGTMALRDHLTRLYESGDGAFYMHVDFPGATITVMKAGKGSAIIELTEPALDQFIADMAYQAEFAYEGESSGAAFRARCRRAADALKEVAR